MGAEIFAAELIYPDQDFMKHMGLLRVGRDQCLPKTLVQLKLKTRTTLSYAGLAIKAERLGYAPPCSLTRIKTWRKFESIYGDRR